MPSIKPRLDIIIILPSLLQMKLNSKEASMAKVSKRDKLAEDQGIRVNKGITGADFVGHCSSQ